MHKLLTSTLVAGLVLFGAASSQAGTLTSATLFSSFTVSTGGTGLTASGSAADSNSASVVLPCRRTIVPEPPTIGCIRRMHPLLVGS